MYWEILSINFRFYANEAKLNQSDENIEKLHVNTRRTKHSQSDTLYTLVRFIDFNEYLLDKSEEDRLLWFPNIGVIVVSPKRKKKFEENSEALFKPSSFQCNVQFPKNNKYLL